MQINKFTEDLMDRNSFFVNVVKFSENDLTGFDINYGNEENEIYSWAEIEGTEHIYLSYKWGESIESICFPKYLYRIYVFLQIRKRLNQKSLPYHALRFIDENNNKVNGIQDLMPMEEVNLLKEKQINSLVVRGSKNKDYLADIDNELRKNGLYQGFSLIRGFLV